MRLRSKRDLLVADPRDPWLGLKMGIATYSFSKLKLDAAIEGIKRVDLHYCSIKDAHLSLKSTSDERKAVAKKFKDAGITPLSCGNISPGDNEANIRNVFEYARDAGIPTIVCSPTKASIPTLDKYVKEFDIKVAIHNHGPEDKVWPSPFDAWEAVQSFDERMGLCIDVGHTARTGSTPSPRSASAPLASMDSCTSRTSPSPRVRRSRSSWAEGSSTSEECSRRCSTSSMPATSASNSRRT